ncbi:MAG: glycosyltransferase family 39 protein, partial [bacterium]
LSFIQDPTVFYLIARSSSAVLGTATVGLVYLIGNQIKSEKVGLVAALFLACSYEHVIHSHYCTVDTALTFLCTLSVYQCLMLFQSNSYWRYMLSGFSIGLALATKFSGALFFITLISAHLLQRRNGNFMNIILCKKLWLGIFAFFLGHFFACPFFYIDLKLVLNEAAELRALHSYSGFNLLKYTKYFIKYYWGIPLGALCFLGFIHSITTRNRKLFVLFITSTTVICFASLHQYIEAKYIIYVFPIFALLGANLFWDCFGSIKRKSSYVVLLAFLIHPVYLVVDWDIQLVQKSLNQEAKEWIEEHIPVNAKILLDSHGKTGVKLNNSPENLKRQYQKALKHKLTKAEYLELKLQTSPETYYNLVFVNDSVGFRKDDYKRYCLWQDLEEIGKPLDYYQQKEFDYIIVTDRFFSQIGKEFNLIKEFNKRNRRIRIYKIKNSHNNPQAKP